MRWEEMPKGHTELGALVKQFDSHCRLEGKPETTCRWYWEILNRFLAWAGDICLDQFTLERVREYLGFPQEPAEIRGASNHAFGRQGSVRLHLQTPRRYPASLLALAARRGVHQ